MRTNKKCVIIRCLSGCISRAYLSQILKGQFMISTALEVSSHADIGFEISVSDICASVPKTMEVHITLIVLRIEQNAGEVHFK